MTIDELFEEFIKKRSTDEGLWPEEAKAFAKFCMERLLERSGWKSYPENKPEKHNQRVISVSARGEMFSDRWLGNGFALMHDDNVVAFMPIPEFTPDPQQQTETSITKS